MLHADLSNHVLGSFFRVYNDLGFGFLEGAYRNALAVELQSRMIDVSTEVHCQVRYRDVIVGRYKLDLVVGSRIAIEVKAAKALNEADERQLLNYLRATDIEVGFLLNFGPQPAFRRLLYTNDRKAGKAKTRDSTTSTAHHGLHDAHGDTRKDL